MDFPRNRLEWIARGNIVLGTVSLIRLITEILFLWTWSDHRKLQLVAAFDMVTASLWVVSGLFLLSRHAFALVVTSISAGAAAGHTIISGLLFGPVLVRRLHECDIEEFRGFLAGVGSRLLHYGIEFVYWPIVLCLLMKSSEARLRHRWRGSDFSTGMSFAMAGATAALLQSALLFPIGKL